MISNCVMNRRLKECGRFMLWLRNRFAIKSSVLLTVAFGKKQGRLPHNQEQVSHLSPFIEGLVPILPTTFNVHGFLLLLLILKPLNIFGSPYVDIAVKALFFFSLLAEWEQCSKHQSSTGNQFLLCKTLSFSVCGECLPSVVFWHFVAGFFFPPKPRLPGTASHPGKEE